MAGDDRGHAALGHILSEEAFDRLPDHRIQTVERFVTEEYRRRFLDHQNCFFMPLENVRIFRFSSKSNAFIKC